MQTLIVILATVMLLYTMVIAWLVYTVATMRADVAYISEVNKVIKHINALDHRMQEAHQRSGTKIDRVASQAEAANAKTVEMDSKVDTVVSRLNDQATKIRRNTSDVTVLDSQIHAVESNTVSNTDSIGEHGVRLVDVESAVTGRISGEELNDRLHEYVSKDELPDMNLSEYAKWEDLEGANLQPRSIRSKVLELSSDDDSSAVTLTYGDDGMGNKVTRMTGHGVGFGDRSLRIDDEGDLSFCAPASGCQKVQMA